MDIHASLRSLRMSPRKVRLVIDTIRGISVAEADTRLTFLKKGAALPVQKLLRSAIANAEHNFKLNRETLFVKTITADGGQTIKRSRPRAFGRGAPIRKRTTHINIILADRNAPATTSVAPAATGEKIEKEAVVKKPTAAKRTTRKSASSSNA
jgi:large subunit ribosomal protein L22